MAQIINQDTEWTSGSTHVLSDVLQIASNVTLRIDPGAVITEAGGGGIQVFGTLDVQGTAADKVQFDNVPVQMTGSISSPASMSIDNAILDGGLFLQPTGNASYGSFSLTNSTLRNVNGYAYLDDPTGNDVISGNLIDGFGGFAAITDGPQILFSHNTFLNIGPFLLGDNGQVSFAGAAGAAIADDVGASTNGQVIIDHNNFLDVGKPTLALRGTGSPDGAMTATNNYFGTSDPAVINAMIFDRNDDLNSPGFIPFLPTLSSPDNDAPGWPIAPTIDAVGGDGVVTGQSGDALVTGTAEAGDAVTLWTSATQPWFLGRTTADASGNWSYMLTPSNIATIGQGANKTLDVRATDTAGNPSVRVTSPAFSIPCFAHGTRILTPSGEVAVEDLAIGDPVITVSGEAKPIKWIGQRPVDVRRHPNRQRVLPVRIAAHAFGRGRPKRNLVLSPDHAVFVEGILIPIRHLINGSNVTQLERRTITYYHIELPRHDVLLADGMPAESYLEAGARSAFGNGDAVIQLHPDFTPTQDHYAMLWEQYGYAPLVVAGETVERVRNLLSGNRRAA